MRNETRFKYNAAMAQLAKLNNVEKVSQKFNVEPSVQQKLEDKIQLSSAFLQKINIFVVPEQSGAAPIQTDLLDGIHTNEIGAKKIAKYNAREIMKYFMIN